MFFKVVVLKNFSIFAKTNLCWSLFLRKLHAWRPTFLLKKKFQYRCFPVNIAKFLRTAFLWITFCTLYFSEIFCYHKILWTSLGKNWHFLYFLYYCFVFLHYSSNLPVIYCEKCEYEFFEYYALLIFFFRSILAVRAKNIPIKKQFDVEIQPTLKHEPAWKLIEEYKADRYKLRR